MHADLRARDSLACDLMEAIRPKTDEFMLELIKNRTHSEKKIFLRLERAFVEFYRR